MHVRARDEVTARPDRGRSVEASRPVQRSSMNSANVIGPADSIAVRIASNA